MPFDSTTQLCVFVWHVLQSVELDRSQALMSKRKSRPDEVQLSRMIAEDGPQTSTVFEYPETFESLWIVAQGCHLVNGPDITNLIA